MQESRSSEHSAPPVAFPKSHPRNLTGHENAGGSCLRELLRPSPRPHGDGAGVSGFLAATMLQLETSYLGQLSQGKNLFFHTHMYLNVRMYMYPHTLTNTGNLTLVYLNSMGLPCPDVLGPSHSCHQNLQRITPLFP